MVKELSEEAKKAYAKKKSDELLRMGLGKKQSDVLMDTVGPALSVQTLRWLMNTWKAFEEWDVACHRPNQYATGRKSNGTRSCVPSTRRPNSEETRDEIRSLFFKNNPGLHSPSAVESVKSKLKEDKENTGSNALEFGLTLPKPTEYKKMLRGVGKILTVFPLDR